MSENVWPLFLANAPQATSETLVVDDKFTLEPLARVSVANEAMVEQAIARAHESAKEMAALKPYERKKILNACVSEFRRRFDELAELLCGEAGKPITDSRGEVNRLIDTFEIAAEESTRINGEVYNLEISPRARGYRGMFQHVPIGPVSLITPFNFPLNLVAHKIAPAIAAGCPFVLKPASRTPLGALVIGEVLSNLELPQGAFSILPCSPAIAAPLVTDDRLKLLSFTGSSSVGWKLKSLAGKKDVALELGGNAACIVDHDSDIDDVVRRLVVGAFYQSGQSCIGVQRILIHQEIYTDVKTKLKKATAELVAGDPRNESTFVGPMIDESEAVRVEAWIQEAIDEGANLVCGGSRVGSVVQATLLENVPNHLPVVCEEVFGPVAVLEKFDCFDQAIEQVNASRFGLQAGVFTRDIYKIQKAWDELEVGGVVIGDVPSWRVDHMPYGGVKDSGLGREGIRFAIEHMTEIRNLVIRDPDA